MLFTAAGVSVLALAASAITLTGGTYHWGWLLSLWASLGAANAAILTPSSRLLARNATEENRPAVFAAQFSLSHFCSLVTYPLAGSLGVSVGLAATAAILASLGGVAAIGAVFFYKEG